jgi:hypothetical protein
LRGCAVARLRGSRGGAADLPTEHNGATLCSFAVAGFRLRLFFERLKGLFFRLGGGIPGLPTPQPIKNKN